MSYLTAITAIDAIPKPLLNQIVAVLDVGAGAGPWSIAFAQALANVHVTAVDFPEVLTVTRECTRQFGVQDRYEYLEGDLRNLDFGMASFDLVILGNVTHCESATGAKLLIERSATALRDKG